MLDAKIYFASEPFTALVEGEGDDPILCIPVGYEDNLGCGVGIIFEEGKALAWAAALSRNLIAVWRATELLRRHTEIKIDTLCACFYAGTRAFHEANRRHVASVVEKIGPKTYADIMAMPVPEPIVKMILDNRSSDLPLDLFPITDEVRAGTIQWQYRFVSAGIEHPDEVDANKRARERLIARFESHLVSFAQSQGIERSNAIMSCIEDELQRLVAKHADTHYPDRAVVALAAVKAETESFALAMLLDMSDDGPASKKDQAFAGAMDNIRERAFRHAARWLAKNPPWWKRLIPWRHSAWDFSFDGADFYLHLMYDTYYSRDDAPASTRSSVAA